MSGVYQVTPDTGDGFRMGVGDPDRKFYPKADGTWPSGIPANASDTVYIRKGGYFDSGKGTVPSNQNAVSRDFSYNDVNTNGTTNTDSFIRPSDGKPYTSLPEGTESFILGPLVGNYAINHGYDDFTNLGYIQKDTRQFVLLGRIQGHFRGEDKPRTSFGGGHARTFDGTASQFTSFNSNFTLEHAIWMQERYTDGNFVSNFPFNFAGGIPVERHPDNNSMGSGDIIGTDDAKVGGDNDDIGTPQDPPDQNDIESLDLWGILKKSLEKFGDFAADPLGALADFFGEYLAPPALEYSLNIAESIIKNEPMEVKQEDIPKSDIDKLIKGFNESADWIDISVSTDGTQTPYADDNFYFDDKGNVKSNIGPNGEKGYYKKDTTGPVDADVGTAGYGNPLAAAGNAQVQVVTGGDGEDYILYTDHAYHNLESDDPREVPDPIKTGLSWLIHNVTGKGDSTKPNTGGMSGYPPNIKGDVKTEVKVDLNDSRVSDKFKDRVKREIYYNQLGLNDSFNSKGRLLKENKKRILRDVRQPLKEIKELPKTTKLKGYKPNFKGKFSPQNTPDVTASKKSDDIVSAKNSSRQVWTAKDKYWKGYETTERMNIIYDNLGFGSQFFDTTTGKNAQLKKQQKKRVQEHLNMLAHQKAMREVYGVKEYENKIAEQETYDNKVKDPLFSKVSDRLNKEIDYPDKPSPLGYPNEAPPKIDPNTGMHPKYGKRYKYDKLDPVSAVMMKRAPTGDPEIDANVKKAAQLKKEHKEIDDEIYEWMLGKLKSDWRKELEEGMTTSNAFSTVLPAEGDTAIDQVSPVDAASFAGSDSFFGPGEFGNNAVAAQKSTQIRSSGSGSGSTGGFDVGGDYLAFQGQQGVGSERWAILKPIDATKVDSITITAIRGTGSNGGEHPDVVGTEELYIRYKTPDMNISRYFTQDRDGNNVGSFPADAAIIGINQGDGTLQNYTITIPEFARQKNVTFALYQKGNSGSQYDHYGVTDIKFQRRTPINVVVPLDSPEAISFIRVGTDEGDPKKRKKKVNDQLAASDEYVAQQMGGEFPGQGTRIDGEDPFKSAEVQDVTEPSPIGKDEVTKSFADFQQGQKTVEVLKTPEQIEAQNDEYFADLENLLVANEYDYGDPQVLEITDKILKLDPKNVDAYYFKDYYYYINDDMESAKGVIDEMIKNIPDSPDGYSLRSFYKQEEGDLAGAIEDLEKAVELEPDPEYVAYIEMELADLKFQKAEEETNEAIKDRLESEAAAIQEKAHQDYWSNAEDLMPENTLTAEQEQQISSNLAQAKDLFNTTHYKFGRDGINSKGAIPLLQEILPLDPNNTEILSNLGVAMIMGGSISKGQQYLEKAQSLDPNVKFDFGINTWDRYDGEETQPYAGARIDKLSNMPHRYAREIIENLPDQSSAQGATYGVTDSDYAEKYGGSYTKYYTDKAKTYSTQRLQSELVDAAREIEDNKYWMEDLSRHRNFKGNALTDIVYVPGYVLGGTKFTGAINGVTQEDWLKEEDKLNDMYSVYNRTGKDPGIKAQFLKTQETLGKYQADYRLKGVSSGVKMNVEKYQAYYDEYMSREVGELPELPAEEIPTLYDWMQTTYDDEKINQEIQEQGFDKQFKELMTAWDSADKFSKFITPLANLSKAFGDILGKIGKGLDDNITAGANNAQLENYKIAIAKSVMLNRPIRVDPTTISTTLKQKLAMGINPNMISTYDVEAAENLQLKGFDKDGLLKYDYIQENPDFEGTGMGVIPVVREPVPYADFNIYTDKAGRVYNQERNASGDTSVPNTTFQPDKSFTSGFMQGAFASLTRQNPLAERGQAQYQIVVPPDGSEPYLLYEDHAYYNIDSQDPGEAPLLNDPAAKFVNWLGNTAYKRNDGDANTGGMAGYPPNIRGDVITKFRINASDLPRGVREAIYRHPFLSENPGIAQAIEDKLYNEKEIKTMLGSKGLHNYYMNRQRLANTFKDFAVDKSIELIMGLPSIEGTKNDLRSASNMLQKYDDYIQATVFQPDGKAYIPGVVDADGRVQSRIDVTDQFTKNDQNHLKGMMFDDKGLQILLKQYVKGEMSKKAIAGHIQDQFDNILSADSKYYRKVLANSLGKGTKVDIDQFLNGKLVLKKNFEFRDKSVYKTKNFWVVETIANMFDVSTDTAAAGGFFTSLATMAAARHLLNPVRGPGILPGMKQTFRQAMNSAPTMPYKLEFDFSEKMMKILQGIEDKSREEEDLGVSATDAATLAALTKKKKKKPMKEQTLYERIKSKPFFNPKDIKPTFPESDPPELDPKTKMHPNYGKQAKRYNKLDPMSANSMPPTGDPEIDAVVDKQRTKRKPSERRKDYIKTASKIKKLAKGV